MSWITTSPFSRRCTLPAACARISTSFNRSTFPPASANACVATSIPTYSSSTSDSKIECPLQSHRYTVRRPSPSPNRCFTGSPIFFDNTAVTSSMSFFIASASFASASFGVAFLSKCCSAEPAAPKKSPLFANTIENCTGFPPSAYSATEYGLAPNNRKSSFG